MPGDLCVGLRRVLVAVCTWWRVSGLLFVCVLGSVLVQRTVDMLCFPRLFTVSAYALCVS